MWAKIKLFFNLTKTIFKGDMIQLAYIYFSLLTKGLRTYETTPVTLQPQVRAICIEMEMEHLLPEELRTTQPVVEEPVFEVQA